MGIVSQIMTINNEFQKKAVHLLLGNIFMNWSWDILSHWKHKHCDLRAQSYPFSYVVYTLLYTRVRLSVWRMIHNYANQSTLSGSIVNVSMEMIINNYKYCHNIGDNPLTRSSIISQGVGSNNGIAWNSWEGSWNIPTASVTSVAGHVSPKGLPG